jgi:hypothetical protein
MEILAKTNLSGFWSTLLCFALSKFARAGRKPFYCTNQSSALLVLSNEKTGGVKVVPLHIDWCCFKIKLFTLRFSKESVKAPSCDIYYKLGTVQRTLFLLNKYRESWHHLLKRPRYINVVSVKFSMHVRTVMQPDIDAVFESNCNIHLIGTGFAE